MFTTGDLKSNTVPYLEEFKEGFKPFNAAFEAAYGIWYSTSGSRNQALAASYLKLIVQFVTQGITPVKNWCHNERIIACENAKIPSVVACKKFFASTLARSLISPKKFEKRSLHKRKVEQAIQSMADLYRTPLEVPFDGDVADLKAEAQKMTDRYLSIDLPRTPLIPLISKKACLERSTMKGGVAAELSSGIISNDYVRGGLMPQSEYPNKIDDFTFHDYSRHFMTEGLKQEPRAKPSVVTEWGGKIRIATLHAAHEVHESRVLAGLTIPILKTHRPTSHALRGTTAKLSNINEPPHKLHLYSADLSKATDNISQDLAVEIWQSVAHALKVDQRDIDAGTNLLSEHRLVSERFKSFITKRGIHMGLGLSWSILSIINCWAANHTPVTSYTICGDDLLGLWTFDQYSYYCDKLARVGIPVNQSKTFRGNRGVFCEKFFEKTVRGGVAIARAISEDKIGDFAFKNGDDQIAMFYKMNEKRRVPVLKVARKLLRSRARQVVPGPIYLGFAGGLPKDLNRAYTMLKTAMFSLRRPRTLGHEEKKVMSQFLPVETGDLSQDQLLIVLKRQADYAHRRSGISAEREKSLKLSKRQFFLRRMNPLKHKLGHRSLSEIQAELKSSLQMRYNNKVRRALHHHITVLDNRCRDLKSAKSTMRRIAKLLEKTKAYRYSTKEVYETLRGMDWLPTTGPNELLSKEEFASWVNRIL